MIPIQIFLFIICTIAFSSVAVLALELNSLTLGLAGGCGILILIGLTELKPIVKSKKPIKPDITIVIHNNKSDTTYVYK